MDREDCDAGRLEQTYRHFSYLNPVLSGWRTVYKKYVYPAAQSTDRPLTLLDVGCGGGDISLRFAAWSQKDGLDIDITAIDPDPRALSYARSQNGQVSNRVQFGDETAEELLKQNRRFDVVITNHVLHHLTDRQIPPFLETLKSLAVRKVLINDIRRSDLGYALFYVGTALIPPFLSSFIRTDGLKSVRRSFTKQELWDLITPLGFRIEKPYPFRLLAIYEP